MKKTIIVAAMLLLALGAKSQDTVWSMQLKPEYLSSGWINTDTVSVSAGGAITYKILAKQFLTKDSLTVYGIAAMLENPVDTNGLTSFVADTTFERALEYVAVYNPAQDSLTLASEQMGIHYKNSVPAYYLALQLWDPIYEFSKRFVYGVHEVFFSQPVSVSDSFYVGMTRQSWGECHTDTPEDTLHYWTAWPIGPVTYMPFYYDSTGNRHMMNTENTARLSPMLGCWKYEHSGGRLFMFPILTPDSSNVDTTHVDTVGINVRLLERYTGLQPNPAAERVQVLSSFGLQHIEVFNAAGTKVQEQKATGYSATLDIRALPAGPYLVRIATPHGTVTKKLLVQRR